MRHAKYLLIAMFGLGFAVGCDDSSSTPSAPAAPSADTSTNKTLDAAKDAAQSTKDAVSGANEKAADAAKGAADKAKDTGAAAMDAVATQAQTLLDQATAYIKENKLDLAEKALTQLEALKAKLPAEWAAKIDSAKGMLETAKKAAGALPGMGK